MRNPPAGPGKAGSTMQDSLDVTTIIFLALAVFVIWRLRSVLGQKTGQEKPPFNPFSRGEPRQGPTLARAPPRATTSCGFPAPRRRRLRQRSSLPRTVGRA